MRNARARQGAPNPPAIAQAVLTTVPGRDERLAILMEVRRILKPNAGFDIETFRRVNVTTRTGNVIDGFQVGARPATTSPASAPAGPGGEPHPVIRLPPLLRT